MGSFITLRILQLRMAEDLFVRNVGRAGLMCARGAQLQATSGFGMVRISFRESPLSRGRFYTRGKLIFSDFFFV